MGEEVHAQAGVVSSQGRPVQEGGILLDSGERKQINQISVNSNQVGNFPQKI